MLCKAFVGILIIQHAENGGVEIFSSRQTGKLQEH